MSRKSSIRWDARCFWSDRRDQAPETARMRVGGGQSLVRTRLCRDFLVKQRKYREFFRIWRQYRRIELQKQQDSAGFRSNSLDTVSGKYFSISGKISRATVNYKVAAIGSNQGPFTHDSTLCKQRRDYPADSGRPSMCGPVLRGKDTVTKRRIGIPRRINPNADRLIDAPDLRPEARPAGAHLPLRRQNQAVP
jgi:hypothetical protein